MSTILYSFILCLITVSLYRPFISNLDKCKYGIIGLISIILAFSQTYSPIRHEISETILVESCPFGLDPINYKAVDNISAVKDACILLYIATYAVSICGLLTRWQFHITFVNPRSNPFISGIMCHGISMALVYMATLSNQSGYSSLLTFTCASTGAMWYLSGPYLVRRWRTICSATLIISATAYVVNLGSSSSLSPNWPTLSFLLVIACNTLDHLDSILNTYPDLITTDKTRQAKFQNACSKAYWVAMASLVINLPSETELTSEPIDDLNTAIRTLGPASRSWKTIAVLFPVNLRQDLCLLYAFFRKADDLVDDAPTVDESRHNLMTIRKFLSEVFDSTQQSINWDQYKPLLSKETLAIFRNFARISHYLCPHAMSEITQAWEHDLEGRPIGRQEDLLEYSALISGTFGELCTCVIMYKTGRGNWSGSDLVARQDLVLSRARTTGQCLQLVNIARDIVSDSLTGRCYVPLQYMPNPPQLTYTLLKVTKNPMKLGRDTLKSFAARILLLADHISDKAQMGIDSLPEEVQDSVRAAFKIYMAIGPTLLNHPDFPLRAKVSKSQQIWIAFRCVYGFRGPVGRMFSMVYNQASSIYFDSLAHLFSKTC